MRFVKTSVLMLSLLLAGVAAAAEVKVEYKDYKKFTTSLDCVKIGLIHSDYSFVCVV